MSAISRSRRTPGCWLLLQGLGTPFFAELADRIIVAGGRAVRVNYCGGDKLFARRGQSQIRCNVAEADLNAFYSDLFERFDPDGIILFGDQRPVHCPAITLARAQGRTALCIEEGYLRPGWLTVEAGGCNAASLLPRSADALKSLARELPSAPTGNMPPIKTDFPARVRWDIAHKAANIALGWRYGAYQTHRPYPMHVEARGWLRRLARRASAKRQSEATWARYQAEGSDFFLVPLQLNSDTQMRVHADVGGVPGFLAQVIPSFAAHAPDSTRLLIKNHPLDNGVIPYGDLIHDLARQQGVAHRVDYIDGGDLEAMLAATCGAILVNSTVGLTALQAGKPVSAHGQAIYRIDGIVDPQPLERFWRAPQPPDRKLKDSLMKVLKTACMVEGDLFSRTGIEVGTRNIVSILCAETPRLALNPQGHVEIAPCR